VRMSGLGRVVLALLAAVGISAGVMYLVGPGSNTAPTAAHSTATPSPTKTTTPSTGGTTTTPSTPTQWTTPPDSVPAPVAAIRPIPRPTKKPTPTPTPTPTKTTAPTPTPTKTATPTPTPTRTATPTPTPTPTRTATPTKPKTTISLTFDDGNANQMTALPILQSHGMTGTFYIITGYVGAPTYLTRSNIDTIAAAGNEIGGHTVTHPDLTTLPNDEVERQVCTSRNTLASWGYTPESFAYPFADANATDEAIVKQCGYNSARMLGDIASRFGCAGCDAAETIPPADPDYLKALDQVDSTWTLADLQTAVTNAEKKGGWLIYTFHNVCDNVCNGDPSISPALFDQFLTWLQAREASDNLSVQTVGSVVGGSVKPLVTPPAPPAPVNGVNGVQNPGFEQGTQCWYAAGYGTNTPSYTIGAPAHSGTSAGQITMSAYTDGDAKWLQAFDLGGCSPSVTPGQTYSLRAFYQSTAVTQFEVYLRNSVGTWSYWTSSPWFAPAATWTQAAWTTDAIPDGMTGISFGLNVFSTGTISTDDYELYNSVGAPPLAPAAPAPAVAPLVVAAPSTTPAPDAAPSAAPATGSTANDSGSTGASNAGPTTGSGPTPSTGTGTGTGTGTSTATPPASGSSTPTAPAAPSDPPAAPPTPPATTSTPSIAPVDPPAPADPPTPAATTDVQAAPAAAANGTGAPVATEPAPGP
jgi:peptidoglycan/xylan/chitin deacetylase (PgdA/CDA1 family)